MAPVEWLLRSESAQAIAANYTSKPSRSDQHDQPVEQIVTPLTKSTGPLVKKRRR
jgi:hypothetical protein